MFTRRSPSNNSNQPLPSVPSAEPSSSSRQSYPPHPGLETIPVWPDQSLTSAPPFRPPSPGGLVTANVTAPPNRWAIGSYDIKKFIRPNPSPKPRANDLPMGGQASTPPVRDPPMDDEARRTRTVENALATLAIKRKNQFNSGTQSELHQILFISLIDATESFQTLQRSAFLLGGAYFPTQASDYVDLKLSEAQAKLLATGQVRVEGKGKGRETRSEVVGLERGSLVTNRRCEKGFERGEVMYRCRDCSSGDAIAPLLCSTCYRSSDHKGHTVTLKVASSTGDYCSCGDTEVWARPIPCESHPVASAGASTSINSLPHPQPSHETAPSATSHPVPESHRKAVHRTLSVIVEYILTTLDVSPEETSLPKTADDLFCQPSLDPEEHAPSGERYLRDTRLDHTYSVVLWNDEKHTREDVMVQLGDAAGMEDRQGWEMAERIHVQGREIVETSANIPRVLHIAHTLAQIDLGVTLRASYDTFRESVSAALIAFLLDLCSSSIFPGQANEDPTYFRSILTEVLMEPRSPTRDRPKARQRAGLDRFEGMQGPITETGDLRRADWLFVYHSKLWKKPREQLAQVLIKLTMVDQKTRLQLADSFARVFHRLIDLYLFVDREVEHCSANLASKLFPVPSIATHVVRNRNLLVRYLQYLQSFYTNQFANKRTILPPSPSPRVDPDSESFKMKKASPLFNHLREILTSNGVKRILSASDETLGEALNLFELFTCMNPTLRAALHHVEYESEAWVKAFQVSGELGRVARIWADAYGVKKEVVPKGSDPIQEDVSSPTAEHLQNLQSAITACGRKIFDTVTMSNEVLDRKKFQPASWHSISFGGEAFETIDFDVSSRYVSFHNPTHWLLAGMLKHVDVLAGGEEGSSSVRELLLASKKGAKSDMMDVGLESRDLADDRWLQLLIDYPLRVVVYVAQLRNGLWVRNGQSMRQQHHHYREHTPLGIREIAWDNDIFLLQIAFCILDPNVVLASILDRFLLLDWFAGNMEHPVYTHPVAGMVEEFLSLIIVCLAEPSNVAAWPQTRFTRREVVHALVLGPSTYSDLVRRLPERANECLALGSIIRDVATFKPSETANDFGTYELKEECFCEVDPLFYHYSRNQKQEVEAILEKRWTKSSGKPDDYLSLPRATEIPTTGPYASLLLAFQSPILAQTVFFTLYNLVPLHRLSNKEGPSSDGKARESQESVLELGLHLAMLNLQHEPALFSESAAKTEFVPDWTLVRLLCQIEDEDLFKQIKGRVRWCIEACQERYPDEVARWRVSILPVQPSSSTKKAPRKTKAAARQAAIMQQFSKDQQAFLDAHGDEDDEMDDEPDSEDIVYGACMVCQEDCSSNVACGSMALIQPSKILRLAPMNSLPWLTEACRLPPSLDCFIPSHSASDEDPPSSTLPDAFPRNNFRFGLYTSTCGHLMHLSCFESYTKTTETRHHAQAARNHPENVARREFNCPLCKSLGNVLLPMQSPYDQPGKPIKSDSLPLRDWLRFINTEALRDVPDTSLMFQHRTETGELPCLFADATPPSTPSPALPVSSLDRQTKKMILDLYAIVRPISQQSTHLRSRSPPESLMQERPTTGMYLPDDLVAYTIAGLEVAHRGQPSEAGQTIADAMNPATTQLLKCLLGAMRGAAWTSLGGETGLVRARYGLFARLLPEWYRDTKIASPLLLREPLGILVEGAAVAYEYLQPILVLTYYAELCRAVLGLLHLLRSFSGRPLSSFKIDGINATEAMAIFGNVRHLIGGMCSHSRILQFEVTEYLLCLSDEVLAKLLYAYTLPFVRRATILHQVVKSHQPAPSSLLFDSSDGPAPPPTASEYARLLHRLHVPSPANSLSPPAGIVLPPTASAISDTISSYLKQFSAFYGPRSPSSLVRLGYPSIYHLATLPETLEGVFERYGRWICPNCGTLPSSTAVCLFCGEGVCSGVSCCKEDLPGASEGLGECNLHMRKCNAPIGVFLDIRKWQILCLFAGSGSWAPNVYLDLHGELDQSLKRGFPQYLHHPRLDEIRKMWLSHGVPSFVARKMGDLLDGGGWQGS